MNPVLIIELLLLTLITITAVTQVIIPLVKGKPLFPLLRPSTLEAELKRLKKENEDLKLHKQVDQARKENLDLLLGDLIDGQPGGETKQTKQEKE